LAALQFLTKRDLVAEHLRRLILHGDLRPGTQLLQNEVAKELRVSSTPVREAFGVLETEGLVRREPHRGVVVARLDYREACELYALRRVLEMHTLERTLQLVDDRLIKDLAYIVKQGAAAVRHPEIHNYRSTTVQFHMRLVEGCGSPILAEITSIVISRSLFFVPYSGARAVRVAREHAAILEALKCGKRAQAARLMNLHLRATERTLVKSVDLRE
jgi:DNA-binding GntR family transcriptional regulator